ncbi:MAG: hypothetical protein ABS35_09060 [Kaistia sp. SCN 65-12]|nr:MAG: hypothetical protein ABS35_09060 [Kaistia sp. SCN 65-12]
MLRNLVIMGAVAALLASFPALYQANPDAFHALFASRGTNAGHVIGDAGVEAQPAAVQPLGRKVVVPSDGRGHYAATFRLNGRQVDALVDTGATLVAINASTARRIGISLNPADFTHSVATANGPARAALATIDRLEIGRISLDDVQAVVLDDQALQTSLIGMSFLNRLDKFQAKDGTLLLAQ